MDISEQASILSLSQSSQSMDAKSFPYYLVMEYMTKPLIDKIEEAPVTEEALKEILSSLETIYRMISSTEVNDAETKKNLERVLLDLVKRLCFPLFYSLHVLSDSSKEMLEKTRALALIGNLITTSAKYMSVQQASEIIIQLLILLSSFDKTVVSPFEALKDVEYHLFQTEETNVLCSLELFSIILNCENMFSKFLSSLDTVGLTAHATLDSLFTTLLDFGKHDSNFGKSMTVLSKLLAYFEENKRHVRLTEIWKMVTDPPLTNADSLWKQLYVFFCLRDFFFPLGKAEREILSSKMSNRFWSIVQSGLVSQEPSMRKLGMYLLKRLVDTCEKNDCTINIPCTGTADGKDNVSDMSDPMFWWLPKYNKSLSSTWESFILLIETLEEKQVHVIKPLLPRMQKLITASSTVTQEGVQNFHSSWIVTIITRCFQHDSHYMSRWGAHTFLSLDFTIVPLIKHGQMKFMSQNLLHYLQENKLYARYEGTQLGQCSPVGAALKEFFPLLFKTLNKSQKWEFLKNVLETVNENTWGAIPVTFLFQGLSLISPEPVLGTEHLKLLRHILQSCLFNHETLTRAATQSFICQTLLHLLDLSSVTIADVFNTLASLNRDESLQRGTTLWQEVVDWLGDEDVQKRWTEKDVLGLAVAYLKNDEEHHGQVVMDGYQVIGIARMLMLCADVEERKLISCEEKKSSKDVQGMLMGAPLFMILKEITDILANIRSREYVNLSRVNRCLSILHAVAREAGDGHVSNVDILLQHLLSLQFRNVTQFIIKQLSQNLTQADDLDQIKFYSDIVFLLGIKCQNVSAQLMELIQFVEKAISALCSPDTDGQTDMLSVSTLHLLSSLLQILHCPTVSTTDHTNIMKSIFDRLNLDKVPQPFSRKKGQSANTSSKAEVGRVISHYISSKWQCRKYFFQFSVTQQLEFSLVTAMSQVLSDAMEDMSIGSGSSDIAIFQAVVVLMPQLVSSVPAAEIVQLIQLGWSEVMEEKKNVLFWRKLEALVPLALHRVLLHQDPESEVGVAVEEFLEKVSSLGSDKSGIMHLVFDHLCGHILTSDPDRALAIRLIPLLVEACSAGGVHKRGERLWLDVCAYIENLGDSCVVNQIMSSTSKNDLYTRAIVLNWLSKLQPEMPADHAFAMSFLRSLMEKYLELASMTTYKQFTNNLTHRHKHRMILSFLLLLDFIKEESCEEFLSLLWRALVLECHASVRQNLEWAIARIIIKFPGNVAGMWRVFAQLDSKCSMCVCSLFFISTLLGQKLPPSQQLSYYQEALQTILPWTMAHRYNTRIFAQATIVRLWEQCQDFQHHEILSKFALVQSSVDFIRNNGNASSIIEKLLSNYAFSTFDPIRDYNMETIFHTLPRLACIADDEWIAPERFLQLDSTWMEEEGGGKHLVPLRNSSDSLSKCKEGPWRMKAQPENEDDIVESADGDVQKKIMPWRQMSPDQETEMELMSLRRRSEPGGLILVTSLIDKVPNLGGLCRTSEIFGVSEFVIGNLAHLDDRMFQSLSVSAQKWISITEVLRHRLSEFLAEKRLQGYTLVGVEQTANSISLKEYTFPKKTLLLLGNEREGIPVDILQSLDVCVEIPQLGVIRSLNVHVCGALIVWEYTRQHMEAHCESNLNTGTSSGS